MRRHRAVPVLAAGALAGMLTLLPAAAASAQPGHGHGSGSAVGQGHGSGADHGKSAQHRQSGHPGHPARTRSGPAAVPHYAAAAGHRATTPYGSLIHSITHLPKGLANGPAHAVRHAVHGRPHATNHGHGVPAHRHGNPHTGPVTPPTSPHRPGGSGDSGPPRTPTPTGPARPSRAQPPAAALIGAPSGQPATSPPHRTSHPTQHPAPPPTHRSPDTGKPEPLGAVLVHSLDVSLGLMPLAIAAMLAVAGTGLVVLARRRG